MSDFDVLMTNPMPPLVIEGLERACRLHKLWEAKDRTATLKTLAPTIRGLASGSGHTKLDAAFLAQFPKLEIVTCYGVGYDQVDAAYAGAHGITVTHTPDVLNEEVADTTFGLLLSAIRQLPQADAFVRRGEWPKGNFPLTASLRGRTMGIIGLGRIGKTIAQRAEAFGLKVAYHARTAKVEEKWLYYPTLEGMARACDILVAILPGGAGTRHIVNAAVLEALGPDGVFINVARGSVVDQEALIDALATGKILTAGLDVFEDEPNVPQALRDMPHIVLAPHVGSGTQYTRDAMSQLVVDNMLAFIRGDAPLTPVPETPWKKGA